MAHVLTTRYGKEIAALLRVSMPLVTNGIFNTTYQGDPKAGIVKIPVRDGEVQVQDYDIQNGANITQSSTSYQDLVINQHKAINEMIDGYEAAAVPDNLAGQRLESGIYGLGLAIEAHLTDILETEGEDMTNTTPADSSNIYTQIVEARTILSEKFVPAKGRWLLVSPATMALLLSNDQFIKSTETSVNNMVEGYVGKIAGFNVMESTLLSANVDFIAGHSQNAHFVDEWKVDPKIEDLTNEFIGSSAVKGRRVYGSKISKAQTIQIKKNA